MRSYKIVEKETSPTIPINKVSLLDGFIIPTADGEAIGIIVFDTCMDKYVLLNDFTDTFESGVEPVLMDDTLEKLMEGIRLDYTDPVEFNFVRVER